ncbi:MAG TPA: zf-TFIIB domain-containing protein [Albitalea sp.]|nr:zf-TFIIB domain-containing protein [Albitalea sp.]
MKCPTCPDTTLLMTDRQGVEIDYCPQCRGVWLDRGELDKLVQMGSAQTAAANDPGGTVHPNFRRPEFVDSGHHDSHGHHYRRKKSWLSEIFD